MMYGFGVTSLKGCQRGCRSGQPVGKRDTDALFTEIERQRRIFFVFIVYR